jgi:hypothetical protein
MKGILSGSREGRRTRWCSCGGVDQQAVADERRESALKGDARAAPPCPAVTGTERWMDPVKVYAGEFEMEALAAGALRVLTGEEQAKAYTGVPVWSGFER